MILRARLILPMIGPPIEDGGVIVRDGRIGAVGRWRDIEPQNNGGPVVDLGEVILLPGLINAHCHLDYTGMAGMISPPKSFPDWIKAILAVKAHWSYTDYAQSWMAGAAMLVRHGVTTVADIESVPELLPEVWTGTPLRVISMLEMTGVKSQRPPQAILDDALAKLDALPPGRCRIGLSPHAPYSTNRELLSLAGDAIRRRALPAAIHLAESAEEFEMFTRRDGALFHWLKAQRDMSDCGAGSPVQHIHLAGLAGPNVLAIHVNYLAANDAALLAESGTSVVHCPRSHDYFRHQPFPYETLTRAGVNVCLATDSMASVRQRPRGREQLNMFSEMARFAQAFPTVEAEKIIRMATVEAAAALRWSDDIGAISTGRCADMIAIPFQGDAEAAPEAVVHFPGNVIASMIDGEWAIEPGSIAP